MQQVCTRCGRRKDVSEFGTNGPGRVRSACLECRRAAVLARRPSARVQQHTDEPTPPPGLAGLVAEGRARWHQCDGVDAHPTHRAQHRDGVVRSLDRLGRDARHAAQIIDLLSTLLVFLTGSLSALLASNGLKSKTKQGDSNETK